MATVHQRTKNDKAAPDVASMALNSSSPPTAPARRNAPHLPTPLEAIALGLFPAILAFGTVFSVLSPTTRGSPYDASTQSHAQDPQLAPSYFARKNNLFNVFFVKRGWGWTTLGFALALATHPSTSAVRRARAGLRWAAVTAWWFFVTQWFFGAPIIDRSFRWTGGSCEHGGDEGVGAGLFTTSVACKTAGGKWSGGHDISGHVFLLVLGTAFLLQEVGWPLLLRRGGRRAEERCVVMLDGAVKSASVEAPADDEDDNEEEKGAVDVGARAALAVVSMNLWMLLMTAIYFHTWFEKFTGLITAIVGIYAVYYVPRLSPRLRTVIGLPGI